MVGTTDNSIQIDEARFAGRQKYNRGRMLNGDNAPLSEDSDAEQENNRNHGCRIDGPWVFGLTQGSDCRLSALKWLLGLSLNGVLEECVVSDLEENR
ncbi:hypothetical protein E2C01_024481 [Portunus trituberculatus]|uniref:Uncharacterized protein n=1 Tax=Portunus trituberculatus TaxID=210409 RepID=A0A5B7ECF6_PORTR|nr:hypothetical protein [Portunus trituberculatus]